MRNVQIFGVKNSPDTRAAERYFKERRIPVQFVDLGQKSMAPAEIQRFVQRFGLEGLLDREGKAWLEGGLRYLKLTPAELLTRIERSPKLMRLPLVRAQNHLSMGRDEAAWSAMSALLTTAAKGQG